MPPKNFPVEASHVMMFARGVGDPNPIYHDPDYAAASEVGHIIAPPTFTAAGLQFHPNHRFRPEVDQPWLGSGKEPTGSLDDGDRSLVGLMHAEMEFEYHKHLSPGDVLTVKDMPGREWQKEGRRGGTLTFREAVQEFRNQNDELMITARSVSVQTGRPVDSE